MLAPLAQKNFNFLFLGTLFTEILESWLPLFLMLNTSRSHFAQQRFIEGVDTVQPDIV